jgi:hypothetical protein
VSGFVNLAINTFISKLFGLKIYSFFSMMMNGKNISDGVLQLNFMRPSLNARATEERKKNKKQTDDPIKVYPTVLGPNDEAVP